jgi:hypothetical protein
MWPSSSRSEEIVLPGIVLPWRPGARRVLVQRLQQHHAERCVFADGADTRGLLDFPRDAVQQVDSGHSHASEYAIRHEAALSFIDAVNRGHGAHCWRPPWRAHPRGRSARRPTPVGALRCSSSGPARRSLRARSRVLFLAIRGRGSDGRVRGGSKEPPRTGHHLPAAIETAKLTVSSR